MPLKVFSICMVVVCVLVAMRLLYTARHEIRKRNAERRANRLVQKKQDAQMLLRKGITESADDVVKHLADLFLVLTKRSITPSGSKECLVVALISEVRFATEQQGRSESDAGRIAVLAGLRLIDAAYCRTKIPSDSFS